MDYLLQPFCTVLSPHGKTLLTPKTPFLPAVMHHPLFTPFKPHGESQGNGPPLSQLLQKCLQQFVKNSYTI